MVAPTGKSAPLAIQAVESVVVDDRCTACGACVVTCGPGALLRAPRRPFVVASRCTGCLACIEVCPRDAITLVTA